MSTFTKNWTEEEIRLSNRIKARNPDAFYEVGDEILHPKRGFGVI